MKINRLSPDQTEHLVDFFPHNRSLTKAPKQPRRDQCNTGGLQISGVARVCAEGTHCSLRETEWLLGGKLTLEVESGSPLSFQSQWLETHCFFATSHHTMVPSLWPWDTNTKCLFHVAFGLILTFTEADLITLGLRDGEATGLGLSPLAELPQVSFHSMTKTLPSRISKAVSEGGKAKSSNVTRGVSTGLPPRRSTKNAAASETCFKSGTDSSHLDAYSSAQFCFEWSERNGRSALPSSMDLTNLSWAGANKQPGRTSRAQPKNAPADKPGTKVVAKAANSDMERPKPPLQCTTTE